MSLIDNPSVAVYQSTDPIVKLDTRPVFLIENGASEITDVQLPVSAFSDQNLSIVIQPPDMTSIMDPHVYLQVTYTVTSTGTCPPGQGLLGNNGTFALRKQPIAATTTNLNFTIANSAFNYAVNESIDALLQYGIYEGDETQALSPLAKDESQEYATLAVPTSARNPLNPFASAVPNYVTRGCFNQLFENVVNTDTSFSFQVTVTEPLFIPPLRFGNRDFSKGIHGVNSYNLNMTFGNLQRAFSMATTASTSLSTFNVHIANPIVMARFYTPKGTAQIPKEILYAYNEVQNFSTFVGTQAGGALFTVNSNNLQLPTIPSKIYMFAKRSQATSTYLTTDTYASLQSLRILFNNKSGILGNGSQQQLYNMSCRNGLSQVDYVSWVSGCGSVCAMSPVADFGLSELQAPGVIGNNYNLQVQATYQNIDANPIEYTFWIVCIYDSLMSIRGGSVYQSTQQITREDILRAKELADYPSRAERMLQGGSFLSSLKGIFSGVHDFVKNNKLISKAAKAGESLPYIGPVLGGIVEPTARLLGYGEVGGGKRLSKAALKKAMNHY